jgi:hypothetical protein
MPCPRFLHLRVRLTAVVFSVYLLYWYQSTNTDATGGALQLHVLPPLCAPQTLGDAGVKEGGGVRLRRGGRQGAIINKIIKAVMSDTASRVWLAGSTCAERS